MEKTSIWVLELGRKLSLGFFIFLENWPIYCDEINLFIPDNIHSSGIYLSDVNTVVLVAFKMVPNDPQALVYTPLCSPLSHCTKIGLCD